jgi:hypothetical protein
MVNPAPAHNSKLFGCDFPAKAKHFPAQTQKIPCNHDREYAVKHLKIRRKFWRLGADFAQFPANFPVSKEFLPETGS